MQAFDCPTACTFQYNMLSIKLQRLQDRKAYVLVSKLQLMRQPTDSNVSMNLLELLAHARPFLRI